MDYEFDYIKNLKTSELIEIIKNIWGFEETSEAMQQLKYRDESLALELGIEIIEQDKGDDYLQGIVFIFIYDINPEEVIKSLYKRKEEFGAVLLGDVMNEISSEFYKDETPKFLTEDFLKDLLKSYSLLESYEQKKITEKYTEFVEVLQKNQISL